MREILIGENDSGQRLDKFLSKALPSLPQSLMYKYIRIKKIKKNKSRTEPGEMLKCGDVLSLYIKEEFFEKPDPADYMDRIRPKLDIVYEDDNIILVDKKPGMLSHSDSSADIDTLINNICAYLAEKGEYDVKKENSFAPALCNRIDRNTGGIVIAAKNAESLREMNDLIKNRKIEKRYLCAVHGHLEKKEDILYSWQIKDSSLNMVKVYDSKPDSPYARDMKTGYRVISENNGISLLDVVLYTGRTHQIRAQFAHIGYPLVGDGKYSKNAADRKKGYKHQALYSYSVKFDVIEGLLLSYLDGRRFEIPKDDIWFAGELS